VDVATDAEQSFRYAEGSGDRFPIHTNDDFARAVGLPGVIVHGMCTLSLCIDAVVDAALAGDLDQMGVVECRFAAILLPGQSIAVRALPVDGGVAFEARRPDGRLVISEGRISARAGQ
jgi:acyl dehydratase